MPEKNKETYQLGMVMETDTRVYFSYNVDQETFGDITVRVMAKLMLLYYPLKTKLRTKAKTVISFLHGTLAPKQSRHTTKRSRAGYCSGSVEIICLIDMVNV